MLPSFSDLLSWAVNGVTAAALLIAAAGLLWAAFNRVVLRDDTPASSLMLYVMIIIVSVILFRVLGVRDTDRLPDDLELKLLESRTALNAVRSEAASQLTQLRSASSETRGAITQAANVQAQFASFTKQAESRIDLLVKRIDGVDRRLKDFETLIGTDDRVKVLMTTTAIAQEIADRKKFQDGVDRTIAELRADIAPVASKIEALQLWLIGSLLAVALALAGVIWALLKRATSLYQLVQASIPPEKT